MATTIKIFDLDDTLFDTKEAVIEAYRVAGAKDARKYWGKPWQEWCPGFIHQQKNHLYPGILALKIKPGWAYDFYCNASERGQEIGILTGASKEAVEAVQDLTKIPRLPILTGFSLTTEEKNIAIRTIESFYENKLDMFSIVYFDDNPKLGLEVVRNTRNVHLITPETDTTIYRGIL